MFEKFNIRSLIDT